MGLDGTLRVLIIDHYDSYTNNLLQLLQGTREADDGTCHSEWSSAVVRFDQYTWYVGTYFRSLLLANIQLGNISGTIYYRRLTQSSFRQALVGQIGLAILVSTPV